MFGTIRRAGKRSEKSDAFPGATQMGVKSLMEYTVYDAAGKCLGEVGELILDTRTGCVRFVVLSMGGTLGFGCKRVAIPWSALTPDIKRRRCVLDVTKMALTAVRVFDDDPWLQRTDAIRRLENSFQ